MALSPATAAVPGILPVLIPRCGEGKPFEPNTESIKRRLLRGGVVPTPKILHALRKKETQKALRRSKKRALQQDTPLLSESQRQALDEDAHFRAVSAEYQAVKAKLSRKSEQSPRLVGKPWEGTRGAELKGMRIAREGDNGGRLKGEFLEELRVILSERDLRDCRWLLDDDVEVDGDMLEEREKRLNLPRLKKHIGDDEKIGFLVKRLSSTNLDIHDWRFSRLMKQSGLLFTEIYLLKIIEGLGVLGNWRQAISVVEWVYNEKDYRHHKSRFVYTKLLAVLGKSRRPREALKIYNTMREDGQIYPDMAAYHTIAVTLGRSGLVKELTNIIDCMRQKPSERLKNMKRRNWDPCLEPDAIIYNAVLNACIPSHQWKGVFWVLEQMRHSGLKPSGATYGLSMEVMLKAGKYDLVHHFFEKMRRSGLPPNALTYRVLVRAFWEEGKIDEAIKIIRDMEQRGVVGTASVYYELACCLCNNGRWRDALLEVEKLKRLPLTKPLEVTFTGMILSSFDGGYVPDCISIFEHVKDCCSLNIGMINAMLKIYGRNDMFAKARELFESIKGTFSGVNNGGQPLKPDAYTYTSMLEASVSAQQWDYFEYVYKEMALCGYQLDQTKHGWLLTKASKSGKWHLLEHAFDTILEAEEIPNLSLFTEMIYQSISQQDFNKTASLINSMAHASIQVKEREWINLFNRDNGHFSEDKLQNLLNHLANSNLVMEDPVPDFLKSLQSICCSKMPKTATPAAPGGNSGDGLAYDSEGGCGKVQAYLRHKALVNNDDCQQHNGEDCIFTVDNSGTSNNIHGRVEYTNVNEGGCGKVQAYLPHKALVNNDDCQQHNVADCIFTVDNSGTSNNTRGRVEYTNVNEYIDLDANLLDCPDRELDDVLDGLTVHIGQSFSKLPSASEILDSWRETG